MPQKLVVKFSPPRQHYSNKNHWGYWTEQKKNQDRYMCDACLIDLYCHHKQTYSECLKSSNTWWLWPGGEKKNLKEFRKVIIKYKKNVLLELELLQEIAENLHKEVFELKQGNKSSEANKKWDYWYNGMIQEKLPIWLWKED